MRTHVYTVKYKLDGETRCERVKATDPGNAFAQAQIKFKGAKVLKARRELGCSPWLGWTEYEPPPVRREVKEESMAFDKRKAAANTATFAFYDEVKKERSRGK
jgi:hypothetical protein